jgi:hypothetical protein
MTLLVWRCNVVRLPHNYRREQTSQLAQGELILITERLSFRAKYGQGDALVALMKENLKAMPPSASVVSARLYTDFTGPMFSVVLEIDHADLNAYAANTQQETQDFGSQEFQAWFAKMIECTEAGERQLFNSEKVV